MFDFFGGEWFMAAGSRLRLLFSVDNGKVNALPLSLASVEVRSITQRYDFNLEHSIVSVTIFDFEFVVHFQVSM